MNLINITTNLYTLTLIYSSSPTLIAACTGTLCGMYISCLLSFSISINLINFSKIKYIFAQVNFINCIDIIDFGPQFHRTSANVRGRVGLSATLECIGRGRCAIT